MFCLTLFKSGIWRLFWFVDYGMFDIKLTFSLNFGGLIAHWNSPITVRSVISFKVRWMGCDVTLEVLWDVVISGHLKILHTYVILVFNGLCIVVFLRSAVDKQTNVQLN